jgi:hypothetical protein
MYDVGVNFAHAQPTHQPKAVATGFKGDRDTRDHAATLHSLVARAIQQSKQFLLVRSEFFQWLALDARSGPAHKPARFAQLDDGYQGLVLHQGREGPAEIIQLRHGVLHRLLQATTVPSPLDAP